MTDIGSQKKPLEADEGGAVVAETAPPEPWTPRRVFEWNSYYDLYVAGFVVLLAFLGSANRIPANNSVIWSLLQAGRQIAATGVPTVTDVTSIAGQGQRWVNIPWLYELSHYGIYETAASLAPKPELGAVTPVASGPREQFGAGALIAVDALVRGLAAFLLLGLRRKGPGLWWTATCVALALGVTLGPAAVELLTQGAGGEVVRTIRPGVGVQIGGIAASAQVVGPETWGLLLLAIEMLVLHQAINLGKPGRLLALVPLFLLWANLDDTFGFGLVILASSVVGLVVSDARRDPSRPSGRLALIALGLCFAVCFINPSHVFGVLAGFSAIGFEGITGALRVYYLVLVGVGLLSFALNRRDFVVGRLIGFVAASVLWVLAFNEFTGAFAVVFAATLALNGQEWYHRTFGLEGQLGGGWTFWSTGGRLVTIFTVFAAITVGVTGWGGQVGDAQFGFGFNVDDFPFEAAEAIKDAPIQGSLLNTSFAQGDAIAWKATSKRKAFVDSRKHLYSPEVFDEWKTLREALRDDAVEKWQPVLDDHKISAVMIQLIGDPRFNAPKTYTRLMNSPNWVPYYDDGTVVIFGRADAKANPADLAYFRANRLDAAELAYRRPRLVPPWERPPTATSELIDRVFQARLLNLPQPHTAAALRWLNPATVTPGSSYLPDPAHCLMAIREARTALSIKPDDSTAFQILIEAYQRLFLQESALIAGIAPSPENLSRIVQAPSQARYLANRNRQLLAAMNFRLGTLPPSKTQDDQVIKANLNVSLAQLYLQGNAFDLARERLDLVAREAQTSGLTDEFLKSLTKQLIELNQRIEQIQAELQELTINRRASPLDRAGFARSKGAPGLAIHELEEANDTGGNIPGVRSTLVDLYCEAGLPDKAFDVIATLNADDPILSTGIGTATYRQGMVYFLLGNYSYAVKLWQDTSIGQLRVQRSRDAPMAGQMLLGGDPVASVRILLDLPEKMGLQSQWEFELGMAALEGGLPPDLVAEHLQTALKLEPNLVVRPLIAYYLELLGKPVPPPRPSTTDAPAKAVEPGPTPIPIPPPTPTPTPAEKSELPADVFAPEPPKP